MENWQYYDGLNARELFGPSRDEVGSWNDWKAKVEAGRHLFTHIVPVMKKIGEQVSVLQGRDYVTGSLVRPSMRAIRTSIVLLERHLVVIEQDQTKVAEFLALSDFTDAFKANFERYIGDHFTNQIPYQVASLLDPRVLKYEDYPKELVNGLLSSGYLTYDEMAVIRNEGNDEPDANLSALERMSREACAGSAPISLIQRELSEYFRFLVELRPDNTTGNPLKFWAAHGDRFPILRRVARRILVTKSSSATVESLFSQTGMIASNRRARLTGKNINMLACLKSWLEKDLPTEVNFGRKVEIRQRKIDLLIARFQYGPEEVPREEGDEEIEDDDEHAHLDEDEVINGEVVVIGEDLDDGDDEEEALTSDDFNELVEEETVVQEVVNFTAFQRANIANEERERLEGIADINDRRAARDLVYAANDEARAARIAARYRQVQEAVLRQIEDSAMTEL